MDLIGRAPASEKGEAFRANVWSWRPIHALIEVANERFSLEIDTTGYEHNDGMGERDNEKCVALAAALEAIMEEIPGERIRGARPGAPEIALNVLMGAVPPMSQEYSASKAHVREFCVFLRHCGGFAIH